MPMPEEPDPDQTLFFKRRKQKVNFLPLIVICTLLLGSGALVVWAINQTGRHSADDLARKATPDPFAGRKMILSNDPRATNNPAVPTPAVDPGATASTVHTTPPPLVPTPFVPANQTGDSPLNLDVNNPDNADTRAEVLRRIDAMPNVSALNKDKLYASVDHAQGMGRVLTIPFEKGDSVVRSTEIERLKQGLASAQIKKLVDDPTVVFVILGYADQKGNAKVNADISQSRATSVLNALRDKCGFQNVMHAVAMGGSTLFSDKQAEKNRVVEIWAVLP